MKTIKYKTKYIKLNADCLTPVILYKRIREVYPCSSLLESFESGKLNTQYSYIGFDRLGSFQIEKEKFKIQVGNKSESFFLINQSIPDTLKYITKKIIFDEFDFPFSTNGFLGFLSYESALINQKIEAKTELPLAYYQFYRYFLVFDHYHDEVYLFENLIKDEESKLENIKQIIQQGKVGNYPFTLKGEESSDTFDENLLENIEKAKNHCARGDVFQLVLSRKFNQPYFGDDFNVYQNLRRLNPSPYLFYFSFPQFNLFGSSPEAQLKFENSIATVNPIAGTYPKTGNRKIDEKKKNKLMQDAKEIAEHMMLVDLARNDLSKSGKNTKVKRLMDLEEYSHVFHLVSEVETEIKKDVHIFDIVFNTFPAGTLSGAPKHKAMQLIQKYENSTRGFYGGCVGIIDSQLNFNHAITIRSVLSQNNCLTYRAGAGITINSQKELELEEINNKLMAIRKAIQNATL